MITKLRIAIVSAIVSVAPFIATAAHAMPRLRG